MTKKNDPEKLVKDLLESFQEDRVIPNKPQVTHQKLKASEADFSEMCNPHDLAALCSLFVSIIGTISASAMSGFAAAVADEMIPEISKDIVGERVTERHVAFVQKLLDDPLQRIAKNDSQKPPDEQRVPIMLQTFIEGIVQFALAMHTLGRLGGDIKFGSGFDTAVYKMVLKQLETGGINVTKGTLPSVLHDLVTEVIDHARIEYEARNDK